MVPRYNISKVTVIVFLNGQIAPRQLTQCSIPPPPLAAPANTVAGLIAGYQIKPKQIHNHLHLVGVKLKENKRDH
jgi:hypothetical protein